MYKSQTRKNTEVFPLLRYSVLTPCVREHFWTKTENSGLRRFQKLIIQTEKEASMLNKSPKTTIHT
jgi:hypothetical protein